MLRPRLRARAQWAGSLFRELDYTKEAANGVRFRELYSRLEVPPPCIHAVELPPPAGCRRSMPGSAERCTRAVHCSYLDAYAAVSTFSPSV